MPVYRSGWGRHGHGIDLEKTSMAMEKGHKVCKLLLLKRWEPAYKKLSLNRETRQLVLSKWDTNSIRSGATQTLDIRLVKEVQTVDYKVNKMYIEDKWKKDKEIKRLDSEMILVISYGTSFVLSHWILLFETKDACRLWCQGIQQLVEEANHASHYLQVERWLRKQFFGLVSHDSTSISMKQMKPFVQTTLQCKVQSNELQELIEGEVGFESFALAVHRLLKLDSLFDTLFDAKIKTMGSRVALETFYRFLKEEQEDEWADSKERVCEFLKAYLRDVDPQRETSDPYLTKGEFVDYLFSRDNSIFDPINKNIIHDMDRPLTNYWIASSHNTYLTGDQIKSESSLDAYSRALMMGCRCIELDCWDGKKNEKGEPTEIIIYHGYTMTSKLNLKDVLYTIRHYAFSTSDFPVILSIEDNCSVDAQRLMATEIKEILGDLLLTAPVSKDETHLPSPKALRKKIILKHKKLPSENETLTTQKIDDDDQDILFKDSIKKGILSLRNNTNHEWTKHVFVLFNDRLCFIKTPVEDNDGKEDTISQLGEEDKDDDSSVIGFGVRPEEMHVTEEWFHGKIDKDIAKQRLLEQKSKGNGVFLVRESATFIGDYSLSFLHDDQVHHVRIKTQMSEGMKRYFFFQNKAMDTLYELISYYTKHSLATEKFRTLLVAPCPQPQPHLNQPWFSDKADKQRAEELLNTVREDGAFLVRYSSSDPNVFVLSLRVDGEFWHYRLKRDGRIFVVNQTVFENLNQIVDFYSNKDFVRGVSLKYPVNERNVGQYANAEMSSAPGCYMELKDLDKEIEALTLVPYEVCHTDALNFPANVVIKVLKKEEEMWKGKYGNNIGWFPPDKVKEINTNGTANGDAVNHETIELAGTVIEKYKTDRECAFRIAPADGHWSSNEWIIAADSQKEMTEWYDEMSQTTRTATTRVHMIRTKEKHLRIASQLSNLVVYCQAVPFNQNYVKEVKFYEMCSFSETKHDKLVEKGLLQFNAHRLSRVYPQGSRLTSTNFMPYPMWNSGCHMVALNYQTGDKPMQFNEGKFIANGRCGYVLKPVYLLDETFRPDNPETVKGNCPIILKITVIAGRQLSRKDKNKGICSPFVDIEIVGLGFDSAAQRTRSISSNGLNPIWEEEFEFRIICPEMSLIRFNVEDGDFVGAKSDPFIGQAVFPVDCLRPGYRSVPLLNHFSEPQELAALLVKVDILTSEGEKLKDVHKSLHNARTIYGQNSYSANIAKNPSITSAPSNGSFDFMHSPQSSPSPSSPSNRKMTLPRRTESVESTDSQKSKKSSDKLKKLFRISR